MKMIFQALRIAALSTGLLATAALADVPMIVTWNINGGQQDKGHYG